MDLFAFAQFSTVLTLGHRATLLFDFEQRSIGMFAGGRAVTFDTGLARLTMLSDPVRSVLAYKYSPRIFLIINENLLKGLDTSYFTSVIVIPL